MKKHGARTTLKVTAKLQPANQQTREWRYPPTTAKEAEKRFAQLAEESKAILDALSKP